MNRYRSAGLAGTFLLTALIFSLVVEAQQTLPIVPVLPPPDYPVEEVPIRPGARMKRFEHGRKIVDRFDARAGDRDVVVERWENEEEGEGPPPGISDVAWRTMHSPVAMVVRVTAVEGYVTPDGTWIESRVTGTLVQLLKNATPARLEPNTSVTFATSGGTIRVGAESLEAVSRTARHRTGQFKKNGDYIVFTVNRPGYNLYVHQAAAFEITGNKLRPLRESQGGIHKRIAEAGADAVVAEAIASRNLQAPSRKRGGAR
jgi:hypothetical protein